MRHCITVAAILLAGCAQTPSTYDGEFSPAEHDEIVDAASDAAVDAIADDPDLSDLRDKVQQLDQDNQALESRVRTLELNAPR